jgi:hypothetical protein
MLPKTGLAPVGQIRPLGVKHYDLAISKVFHYGFLRGHSSTNYGCIKENNSKK